MSMISDVIFPPPNSLISRAAPFQGVDHDVGIGSPFKAEGRICIQPVAARCFTNEHRIEARHFPKIRFWCFP